MQGHHAEHKESGDGEKKLGWLERCEAGNQDPRGNGSQRRDQRILHGTPIVAGPKGTGGKTTGATTYNRSS
jgi:hypothetical protein